MQKGRYKTGVRYCLETWPDNIVLRMLDSFLAMSSMFGYTATLVLIPLLATLAYLWSSWIIGTLITGLVLSVLLPAEPLLWEWFQLSTLVSSWRRYFQFSIAVEQKLDAQGQYIFAELLCISLMLKVWPTLKVYSIAASSVFKVPVWRHIMCWTGARPATADQFRQLLTMGSVSLVPGGIAEIAPLFMAVGAPIPVTKVARGEPGFQEAVNAAHAQLVMALADLYQKYKGQYGWEDRELVVN
eukprot:gene9197-9364_t